MSNSGVECTYNHQKWLNACTFQDRGIAARPINIVSNFGALMHSHYKNLVLESIIHFLIMYAVMYTMVDTFDDVYINVNNFYMTGMMAFPMVILMIVTMKSMYPNKKLNLLIGSISLVLFISFYFFERNQSFVGDKQFIKSMIPHHSGAILMCNKSQITDLELQTLCEKISTGQRQEIDQMKNILKRLSP